MTTNCILSFAVANKAERNAWSELCLLAHETTQQGNALAPVLSTLEEEFRTTTGERTLPVKYRSAKSMVLSALSLGIPVLSERGLAIPKTRLGVLIKETKAGSADPMLEWEHKVNTLVDNLVYCQRNALAYKVTYDPYVYIKEKLKHVGYI